MTKTKVNRNSVSKYMIALRVFIIFAVVFTLIPALNPARMSEVINRNDAFVTMVLSRAKLYKEFSRFVKKSVISQGTINLLYFASLLILLCIIALAAGWCMSLGTKRLQKLGLKIIIISSFLGALLLTLLLPVYSEFSTASDKRIKPMFPIGFVVFLCLFIITAVLAIVTMIKMPKLTEEDKYGMEPKYKLFLMVLPFVILCFVFSYLPLWGWRYAFFDYKAGGTLGKDNFVAFKWFKFLFQNKATRNDIVRVLRNTLAMSGLGLATSWSSMAFAIFLCEIKNMRIRRLIQTFTTIPNFISWVLVYSFATLIFSSDGIISNIIVSRGGTAVNFLMSSEHIWLKMLAWGMWKGIGWSAIVYIAGISGIDQQLYEAATVDGAGRFRKMWHVTVPGLLPTYFVLLLLQISGILSNGMEQYLVFKNPYNTNDIMVLDLYVYELGIGSGKIPLTTVVGMVKSLVSVTLLLSANKFSKVIRGESLI